MSKHSHCAGTSMMTVACVLMFASMWTAACGPKDPLQVDSGCEITVMQLAFGTITLGESRVMSTTINNVGAVPLVFQPEFNCSHFTLAGGSPAAFSLDPGESVDLAIAFAPDQSGLFECEIALSGISCGPIECSGTGSVPIHEVHPDGSGPYVTIQAAIDAAEDGDIVQLSDGTFMGTGNLNLVVEGKSLTIRSASGEPGSCSIRGRDSFPTDIRILNITDCFERDVVIQNITLENGVAHFGGAVVITNASPRFDNVMFATNDVALSGGAVYVAGNSSPVFTNCQFTNNRSGVLFTRLESGKREVSALSGGAIYVVEADGANLEVRDCYFSGNQAGNLTGSAAGGAICGRGQIVDCEFRSNVAHSGDGGACYLYAGSIARSVFYANSAGNEGGALYVIQANIAGSTIVGSSVTGRYGAGVYCGGSVTIQNSIVAFNGPVGIAGELWAVPALYCCNYFGNGDDGSGYIWGQLDRNGNFTDDPLFTDRAAGVLSLRDGSPCLPGGHGDCDLIGAPIPR